MTLFQFNQMNTVTCNNKLVYIWFIAIVLINTIQYLRPAVVIVVDKNLFDARHTKQINKTTLRTTILGFFIALITSLLNGL